MTPTFLDPLVWRKAGRFELVHVESGAVLASQVESALEGKARRRGLRGRDSLRDDTALVFAPSRFLRTFFARLPVDAVFVSRDGTILKVCRAVRPWRVAGSLESYATIVFATGFIDRSGTTPGDRVALREAQAPRPAREILPETSVPAGSSTREPDVDPWGLGETVPGHAGSREVSGRASDVVPQATGGPEAAPAGGDRNRLPDTADLDRILSRRTPIAWFEAVAVVMEVCEEVVARGPENDLRVPELSEIAITPGGGVELLGQGPSAPSVEGRVACILRMLLGEARTLPVQLRVLALGEGSLAPGGTLREFSSRLALFERPGRRGLLRGLYDRFQQMPAPRTGVERAAPPTSLTPPRRLPRWRQRRLQVRVGVAALAVLVALVLWLWPGSSAPGTTEHRGPLARAATAARQEVADVVDGAVHTVARWLGLAAPVRAAVPADHAPADAGVDSPASRRARRAPRAPVRSTAPDAASRPAPLDSDTTIFTEGDPRVVPPRYDRPRLPANPPPGVSQEEVPQVEAVISATGEVESVRLITKPAGVRAAMMLSAVKNWRFEPATKDGQPVRYRMRVRLTNQ